MDYKLQIDSYIQHCCLTCLNNDPKSSTNQPWIPKIFHKLALITQNLSQISPDNPKSFTNQPWKPKIFHKSAPNTKNLSQINHSYSKFSKVDMVTENLSQIRYNHKNVKQSTGVQNKGSKKTEVGHSNLLTDAK